MPFIMGSWKIIQRKTYDILSHKYSFVFVFLGFLALILSVIQFGEVWIEWSLSDTVYNSFSDNVIGKSLQKKLCQIVPIDVVYTWVNGSDPVLLQQIQDYQKKVLEDMVHCQYRNCMPSHIAAFRGWYTDKKVHLNVQKVQVKNSLRETSNWTLVKFTSPTEAEYAKHYSVDVGNGNITLHQAYWTSDVGAASQYLVPHAVMINGLRSSILSKLAGMSHIALSRELKASIENKWIDSNAKSMVLECFSPAQANTLLKRGNITIFDHKASVTKAYLVLEIPLPWDSKDFAPSRFEDKEELRYSLRSLEMYAPWVRHVYLITNGQIPYWLNLDNPRLTVLTHEEIFPNHSHLPTFSSPAIESHIHTIPGLSQQFLYLNDDVFFGQEVWPEDFVTHASGQKVYLSWSVPDCSDSCPWSWVGDGSCDISCNTSECSFDGGDCNPLNANFMVNEDIFYDEHRSNTMDSPLDDMHLLDESHLLDIRDLTSIQGMEGEAIRTAVSTKAGTHRLQLLNKSLYNDSGIKDHMKRAYISNTSSSNYTRISLNSMGYTSSNRYNNSVNKSTFVDVISSDLTNSKAPFLQLLHPKNSFTKRIKRQSMSERKKKRRKRNKSYLPTRNVTKQDTIFKGRLTGLHVLHDARNFSTSTRKWRTASIYNGHSSRSTMTTRQQRDRFSESLLFVNRLYNREFGFEIRKVPAHMPHLIDKKIMERLQKRFPDEWEQTSSHKIRRSQDMQYAFSYFYFLMSEKENRTFPEIFDIFDTDKSGTWSDREIRTLLSKVNDLPLNYQKVLNFEAQICNCSLQYSDPSEKVMSTPLYERYQDSKLPVVSKKLIDNCPSIKQMLLDKFGTHKKYRTEVIKDTNHAVTFKMLRSNLSQLILMLDEVRREPKKFICFNNNLDPSLEKDNAIITAVLQDFYESLFPLPSTFELPSEYRNRFLHMSELQAWRMGRNLLRNGIYVCLIILISFTALSFLQVECCIYQRRRSTRKIYQDV